MYPGRQREQLKSLTPLMAEGIPSLVAKNITMRFVTSEAVLTAVDDVSLDVKQGEFLAVIGPSGCGKSTLFNIIGGLLGGYEGEVSIEGRNINGPHPDIGMV